MQIWKTGETRRNSQAKGPWPAFLWKVPRRNTDGVNPKGKSRVRGWPKDNLSGQTTEAHGNLRAPFCFNCSPYEVNRQAAMSPRFHFSAFQRRSGIPRKLEGDKNRSINIGQSLYLGSKKTQYHLKSLSCSVIRTRGVLYGIRSTSINQINVRAWQGVG